MRSEQEIGAKKSALLKKRNACLTHGSKCQYDRMIDALEWVLGERDILDGSLCGDPERVHGRQEGDVPEVEG